jgi:hypothetical protein
MAAGALPFLFDRERVGEGAEGGATVGIFCLLDCRVEDPDSEEVEVVVLLGLLSSLGKAAFRFRLVGVVVEGGSAPSLEEVAFGKAAGADAPDERDAWATWRADDLVILADMSMLLVKIWANADLCVANCEAEERDCSSDENGKRKK